MRSGYTDEDQLDPNLLAMFRGHVASAMRGKRGQALLKEALAALDAMPTKRLISELLVDGDDVCLLGACGKRRNLPEMDKLDPEDHNRLARIFDVAECLIQEIEYVNDEAGRQDESPEQRFTRVRTWLIKHIKAN